MEKTRRFFWMVAPLEAGGSRKALFTYYSTQKIAIGAIVKIPLRARKSLGVIMSQTSLPTFITKPVSSVLPLKPLPAWITELAQWISYYYATPLGKVWQTMLPPQLAVKKPRDQTRPPPFELKKKLKLRLAGQQQAALNSILTSSNRSFLLHGITGSGKTQVYIELAAKALAKNLSTIVLVPEIALTHQIAEAFSHRFGEQVIITHSALTSTTRRNLWRVVLESARPLIIVGPRSALFMPVASLGFIIIDEAHETSYKQDQAPRYHAAPVAAKLADLTDAKLILGSATPSATDYFLAQQNRLTLVKMNERIHQPLRQPPKVIDLRQKSSRPFSPLISTALLDQLKLTLAKRKQAILFMNRRGSARLVLCSHCNWVAECVNCHIPLTFHADKGVLLCHWCGLKQKPPGECPNCSRLEVRFLGGGTKRVEAEITKLLPTARIARLDKDSFDPKTISELFEQLQNGKIDILIGTQMVAKGLDIANVETIGIISADSMLYLPDFSAAERTFQLLYQVSGRAGRRVGTQANVIIQTYSPEHPTITAVLKGDYESFMASELIERKQLRYPPHIYLLKLTVARASRSAAQSTATKLADQLRVRSLRTNSSSQKVNHRLSPTYDLRNTQYEVIGPAPDWRETIGGRYRWQLIVKSKQRSYLVAIAESLPAGWTFDLDPTNLL